MPRGQTAGTENTETKIGESGLPIPGAEATALGASNTSNINTARQTFFRNLPITYQHAGFLAQYQQDKIKFDPQNMNHTQLVDNCSSAVKNKLDNLQKIDIKMIAGLAVGVAAFALSWILPFTTLAIAGFAYSAYQLGLRQNAYNDYTHCLENLAQTCKWTLGEVQGDYLAQAPTIQLMVKTLAPVMNSQNLRDLIDDKVEDLFIKTAEEITKKGVDLQTFHFDDARTKNIYFEVYGYKRGGIFNILAGIGYDIRNGFSALFSKKEVSQLKDSHVLKAGEGHTSAQTNQEPVITPSL